MSAYRPTREKLKNKNKKIVISYFEAFGRLNTNSSKIAIEDWYNSLDSESANDFLIAELPVQFGVAAKRLIDLIQSIDCAGVVMFGQAEKRAKVSLELRAKNKVEPRFADNAGQSPQGKIEPEGKDTVETSWDFIGLFESLGAPELELSEDAGEYVCNELFYRVRSCFSQIPTGFIHLPLVEPQENYVYSKVEIRKLIHSLAKKLKEQAYASN